MDTDKKGRHQIVQNLLLAVLLLGGTWWALFNVDFLYESIGYRMEGLVATLLGEGETDASTQIRLDMIDEAIELWKNSPLLGNGIDSFQKISSFRTYAHNNYAEILCDLGIVGLLAYYWFYVSLLAKNIKRRDLGKDKWFWLWVVICILLFDYGAVSYDVFPIHIMMLCVSAALRFSTETTKSSLEGGVGENGQFKNYAATVAEQQKVRAGCSREPVEPAGVAEMDA